MKLRWNALKAVAIREARRISHDVNIISIVLLAPLFYSLFYGSLYWNKGEHDVEIVVVDLDHTALSRQVMRALDAHKNIHVRMTAENKLSAEESVRREDVHGIVVIPAHFEEGLKCAKGGTLEVLLNTSRFLVSNDINKGVNEVVIAMNTEIRSEWFERRGSSLKQATGMVEPMRADIRPLFNTTETYGDFLIPGVLLLILHQTLMMGLSESVAKEREEHTFGEYFRTSQGSLWAMINGKGLFYYVLFAAYALLFMTGHFWLFSLPFRGSVVALIVLTLLWLLAIVYLSMFVSSFFHRKIIALQVLAFTSYPIFLISGYSWPMYAMPQPIQWIAQCLPLTPYSAAFTRIVQMGASFSDVLPETLHLLVLVILSLGAVRWRMKTLIAEGS